MPKTTIEKRRCPQCRKRTLHRETASAVRPDPKRPNDRRYDVQPVAVKCLECGRREVVERCWNLTAHVFSV